MENKELAEENARLRQNLEQAVQDYATYDEFHKETREYVKKMKEIIEGKLLNSDSS